MLESDTPKPQALQAVSELSSHEMRQRMQQGDLAGLRALVIQAGAERRADAIPALARLLRRPHSLKERLRARKPGWIQIRLAAIESLRQIGNLGAMHTLTMGLFDSETVVQTQASLALRSFGGNAVSPILEGLSQQREWTKGQMRLLIETLDAIGDRQAGPALARILLGQLPQDSARWSRTLLTCPACLIVTSAIFAALMALLRGGDSPDMAIGAFLVVLLAGFFLLVPLYMLVLMPIGMSWANAERLNLAEKAADAMTRLGDKRALPSVIEAAYGPRRSTHRMARKTLLELLPLVTPQDESLLPPESIRHLTRSLSTAAESFSPQKPDLTIAILYALREVGPGTAAETVQKLYDRSRVPQVRIACREVLPVLEERRRLELAASSLLRASAMPATPSDQLLRAAMPTADHDPAQLLRPGQQD